MRNCCPERRWGRQKCTHTSKSARRKRIPDFAVRSLRCAANTGRMHSASQKFSHMDSPSLWWCKNQIVFATWILRERPGAPCMACIYARVYDGQLARTAPRHFSSAEILTLNTLQRSFLQSNGKRDDAMLSSSQNYSSRPPPTALRRNQFKQSWGAGLPSAEPLRRSRPPDRRSEEMRHQTSNQAGADKISSLAKLSGEIVLSKIMVASITSDIS